jgi:NAD(P)-dependent dehydrogenase (short-subunit alcohol dehydrogenase family)
MDEGSRADVRELAGKVALVTGAGSGIGRGIAVALATAGAAIAVNYRRNAAGAEESVRLVEAAGGRAIAVHADVGDEAAVDAMFDRVLATFDRVDILVNNAGHGGGGRLLEAPFPAFERVLRTNLYGALFCAQRAARRMIEQGTGGRIVNITSVHEEAPGIGGGAYCVSKAALTMLTRSLALELAPQGITVNSVAPGMILTGMNAAAESDPAVRAAAAAQIPARRAGLPADIAAMVRFLCSDAASYCTGSTHFVDGGWMLTWPPV